MGEIRPNNAYLGMNLDAVIGQVKPGQVTYALNGVIAAVDGNQVTYQNEPANELCFNLPDGYVVIGSRNIIEKGFIVYWLVNPVTGDSEIGKVTNCQYERVINSPCLNFSIDDPILKSVYKITSCSTEIYWPSKRNPRRYIDLDNLPYKEVFQGDSDDPCDRVTTQEIDCNKLNIQPNFAIPQVDYREVNSDGDITEGTYQFAIQYANSLGEGYTSYYTVTNPIPIHDYFKVSPDFNRQVSKSIVLDITNIDATGIFDYINVAVIKTINNISSVDLVGTFQISGPSERIVYTGQSKAGITLTIDDIFEKFPTYDRAGDVTTVQDILLWSDMTTSERINYQEIASKLKLQWVSWKLPPSKGQYKDEINAADLKSFMRDEVYPLDLVLILKNGYQTDRIPLIGRPALPYDLQPISNQDALFEQDACTPGEPKPRWKVYNTATVQGVDPAYDPDDDCYQGPYQYGDFAYWESTETYPCNEAVWGDLQGQPIRFFKFPDSLVSPHHDSRGNIYPIGVRIDMEQLHELIRNSNLTQAQKDNIAAVKIVRGDRANSKSVIAKGLLFNVGAYSKKNSQYFYPNYPFNDLRVDPFISIVQSEEKGVGIFLSMDEVQNVEQTETDLYSTPLVAGQWKNDGDIVNVRYDGRFAGNQSKKILKVYVDGSLVYNSGMLTVGQNNTFQLTLQLKRTTSSRLDVTNKLQIFGDNPQTKTSTSHINGIDFNAIHTIKLTGTSIDFNIPSLADSGDITATGADIGYRAAPVLGVDPNLLSGFSSPDSQRRHTFFSPDTTFFQPSLGNILKLETVEYGNTRSHFVEVKNHARYAFPSIESYITALGVGVVIGFASGTYGVSTNPFNGAAAFTAFQVFNDIVFRLLPKKNMAYQFNSLGNYVNTTPIPNDVGNKIRQIDIGIYLTSGMQGVGDTRVINNYQRESSVYLRTTDMLPYPDTYPGVPVDNSRFTLGDMNCVDDFYTRSVSAYYGSIKRVSPDQYGQIHSYSTVDTGYQFPIDIAVDYTGPRYQDVFGGDTFINKFGFKRKMPFFLDNRVNFPDNADVFYDELGNVGYPRYWFSTDIRRGDGGAFNVGSIFGVKVNNFDCENAAFFYNAGKIYLFAYGIVNFFVESAVNVDLRQAYNDREGDYYPRVGSDVPDDWLQESFVSINYDNTYTYNKTYSKQNTENVFTTLPVDFIPGQDCREHLPNRAVYSEQQQDVINYRRNNWRVYRPVSFYDFPLNYGKLTSLDGIETRQILARFENKSMVYNALLTAASSIGEVYLGQQMFNKNVPPVDFAETDTGYAGSQHKFLLRTERGHVSIDAKRGQVILFRGTQLTDLGGEGLQLYLKANLPFAIREAFPTYEVDNNFAGVGLHGTYDTRYDRLLITKLDYAPLNPDIAYDGTKFTLHGQEVFLYDTRYFCNKSFTLSYWFKTQSWISFHSYRPRFYVADINKFYTGILGSVWTHGTIFDRFNEFYGQTQPYVLEYPFSYQHQDEILQCVRDYTKVNIITSERGLIQTNDVYFNKAIVYNDQECSGVRNLIAKPKNNMVAYLQYPRIGASGVDILFTKSNNFYNYNGIWDVVKDPGEPIWVPDCSTIDKVLNEGNMDYTPRSFKKYPLMAKDCRIRHILDNRSDARLTSQFMLTETQISYK